MESFYHKVMRIRKDFPEWDMMARYLNPLTNELTELGEDY